MSVKRTDLVRLLEKHGFYLLREGAKHAVIAEDSLDKTSKILHPPKKEVRSCHQNS